MPTGAGTAVSRAPTDQHDVLAIRSRQVRNLMATLMLSQGVPMIMGGDEFLRTQRGNNNAWCQDNAISWVDWSLRAERTPASSGFVRMMIALRKAHPVLRRRTFFTGERDGHAPGDRLARYRTGETGLSRTTADHWPGRFDGRRPIGPTWSTATSTSP